MIRLLTLAALVAHSLTLFAQDTSVHEWLVPGEEWKPAVTGQTFTDGLCCDKQGNLFFTDVRNGVGIYKLDVDSGKVSVVVDQLPGISGLQIGPDGRFYACHNKAQRVIAINEDNSVEELLSGIKCNDLVVTMAGNVYVTETPTKRIHLIKADKSHVVADEGHVTRPNGISVSPDQKTLAVSDHGGTSVWTWVINDDGTLAAGAPYMPMQAPLDPDQSGGKPKPGERPSNLPTYKKEALGDGMTTESTGRWFVTTALGVQVFDPAGRLSGILSRPTPESKVVSAEFAGKDHNILYIAAGDTIWGRKLNVKGWFGTGQ